jgi:hypothetical protein
MFPGCPTAEVIAKNKCEKKVKKSEQETVRELADK